ncbi:hypothetical protein Ancab_026580 [Ancistrocladus abbreviatus]
MYANILHPQLLTKPSSIASIQLSSQFQHHHHHRHHLQPQARVNPIRSTTSSTRGSQSDNETDNPSAAPAPEPAPAPPTVKPPETVEIRFRRGSRRHSRRQQDQDRINNELTKREMPSPAKKWEEMSPTEKALELYMGEKGLLFWLNKFAYASIFIVIGGWILFRFVGPSLNLYQLDAPPLPPTSMFKGS